MTFPSHLDNAQFSQWQGEHFRPVNQFYRSQKHKGSASGEEQVFIIELDDKIVGAVRLVPYPDYFWLRSLQIEASLKGQRLGSRLLAYVHKQIDQPIYCFPFTHLDHFYTQAGYQHVKENNLPESIAHLFARYSRKGQGILAMGIHIPLNN